ARARADRPGGREPSSGGVRLRPAVLRYRGPRGAAAVGEPEHDRPRRPGHPPRLRRQAVRRPSSRRSSCGRRSLRPSPVKTTELAAKQAKTRSPLTDSNRRPPPYHALRSATARNPRQRFPYVLAASAPISFATDCDRLQPRGSIKAPSLVANGGDIGGAALAAETPPRSASGATLPTRRRGGGHGG